MTVTSRTINCIAGQTFFVVAGHISPGLLIGVAREGLFYKRVAYVDLSAGGMVWAYFNGRVRFPTDQPFNEGEKCVLIYKI